jgi:hypothetical protein
MLPAGVALCWHILYQDDTGLVGVFTYGRLGSPNLAQVFQLL